MEESEQKSAAVRIRECFAKLTDPESDAPINTEELRYCFLELYKKDKQGTSKAKSQWHTW